MSRRCIALSHLMAAALLFCGGVCGGGGSMQARAQDAADRTPDGTQRTAETMIDRARTAYGPLAPRRPKPCGNQDKAGDIVVCAPGDGKQWRIPPTSETDPNSRTATRTGVPRAPQLDRGSCKGSGRIGCIGLGGKGREIYMIDLSSIPATPKGSDAEKVANGEMSDR